MTMTTINASSAGNGRAFIRPARQAEIDDLTALCRQSKRHWGYDDAFMALSADILTVTREAVEADRVIVAEDGGRPRGVAAIEPFGAAEIRGDRLLRKGDVDLALLFVAPDAMGRGFGRLLFEAAAAKARAIVGRRLVSLSDPNARAFYEAMGAAFAGMAHSDTIPGRELPLLILDL